MLKFTAVCEQGQRTIVCSTVRAEVILDVPQSKQSPHNNRLLDYRNGRVAELLRTAAHD